MTPPGPVRGTRKPRLCFLLPSHWASNMGGAEYQARLILERLIELDMFELHYVARHVPDDFTPRGYTLHRIARGPRVAGSFLPDTRRLWRVLGRLQPDILYQRVGCAYTGVAAFYARTAATRMVWHVSSDRDVTPATNGHVLRQPLVALDKAFLEYGVRNAHAVVVQSAQQRKLLRQHYGRNCAALVPNFHPAIAESLAKPRERVRVCWIANMKPLKRPELFLQLAHDLRHLRHVEFVMAGAMMPAHSGGRELERRMEDLPNLRHLGVLPLSDVNRLLASSHLLVNTSDFEGFSNAFIQAWLREVPVVSLSVNPDGVFAGDRYGICAEGGYAQMRAAVERLAQDRDVRTAMGRRAREYAIDTFSINNIDRLLPVFDPQFDSVIETPPSSERPARRASL
jgi:glycosyltransferase involved in cell wall biosynthesis